MVLNPIVVRGPRRRGVGDGRIYRGIIRFRSHLNGPGVGRRRVDAVVIQFRSRVTGPGAEESAPYARPPIRRVVWASAGTTTNSARCLGVGGHDHQFGAWSGIVAHDHQFGAWAGVVRATINAARGRASAEMRCRRSPIRRATCRRLRVYFGYDGRWPHCYSAP